MELEIDKIIIKPDRIRKEFGDIAGLAENIKEIGQIHSIIVTPEYELVTGERRFKAIQYLGYETIRVEVKTFEDYLHQLRTEIAENEYRKDFTVSEKVAWGKKIEEIEKIDARVRSRANLKQNTEGGDCAPRTNEGKTRDKVAQKVGFGSSRQYERAKFVVDNASDEVVEQMDKQEISIHKAHKDTKEIISPNLKVEIKNDVPEEKEVKNFSGTQISTPKKVNPYEKLSAQSQIYIERRLEITDLVDDLLEQLAIMAVQPPYDLPEVIMVEYKIMFSKLSKVLKESQDGLNFSITTNEQIIDADYIVVE